MNYQETLDYFFSQLPMFHRIGATAYKADLEKTYALAAMLGNPQQKLRAIHIAGTNGKGSVSHMLASVLQEAGYKTGLYTSPHLKDFRERIRINGHMIPKSFVSGFVNRHKKELDAIQPSFFEMSFGLCLEYFSEQNTEIAVMETGMGGRLDSTNILNPDLCVITNISFDHTQFLGDSLVKIAFEKAGIIKTGIPVVVGEANSETKAVFIKKARDVRTIVHFASDHFIVEKLDNSLDSIHVLATHKAEQESQQLDCPLAGDYQLLNIRTLLTAIEVLNNNGFRIGPDAIRTGILKTKTNTAFRGRWELIRKRPRVICDTGHNLDGIHAVMTQLFSLTYTRLHLVLGFVEDKNLKDILGLFPKDATYYFCKADIPRGLNVNILQQQASASGLFGKTYDSVREAYKAALSAASNQDLIFIGGSTFVVAEVI
ncbi:MAG: folylpolyglutamate synthase/dihydrofolate synthase family protein [Bacteroidota bacterium]